MTLEKRLMDCLNQHMAAGSAFERLGDAATAGRARAIANMLGSILQGHHTSPLIAIPSPADKEKIEAHCKRLNELQGDFDMGSNPERDEDDWEKGLVFDSGAHLAIKMVLGFPKEAQILAIEGALAALEFLEKRLTVGANE